MSLIPYDPFQQLSKALDRLFSDFPSILEDRQHFGGMRVDIQETEKEVVATCSIPGLSRKEDVEIEIKNDVLTLRASINKMADIQEDNMFCREHYVGRFHRSIPLPCPVSPQEVQTSYHDETLRIRIPKSKRT